MSGCWPPHPTRGGQRFPQDRSILGCSRAYLSTGYPQCVWVNVDLTAMHRQATNGRARIFTDQLALSTSGRTNSTCCPQVAPCWCCEPGVGWFDIQLHSSRSTPALSTGDRAKIHMVSLWSSTAQMGHHRSEPSGLVNKRENRV